MLSRTLSKMTMVLFREYPIIVRMAAMVVEDISKPTRLMKPSIRSTSCIRAMMEPIPISSGFRCQTLNNAVGGVRNSQHLKGEAADLCIGGDIQKGKKWFAWIKAHCEFDQLIWEHNSKGTYWVHVSYRADGQNRKQAIDNYLKK